MYLPPTFTPTPTLALRANPSNLSPQTSFFLVREDAKAAVLLHLLRNVVRPQDQTVVFVATRHHAEYLSEVSRDAPKPSFLLRTNTYSSASSELQFRIRPPESSTRAALGPGQSSAFF